MQWGQRADSTKRGIMKFLFSCLSHVGFIPCTLNTSPSIYQLSSIFLPIIYLFIYIIYIHTRICTRVLDNYCNEITQQTLKKLRILKIFIWFYGVVPHSMCGQWSLTFQYSRESHNEHSFASHIVRDYLRKWIRLLHVFSRTPQCAFPNYFKQPSYLLLVILNLYVVSSSRTSFGIIQIKLT